MRRTSDDELRRGFAAAVETVSASTVMIPTEANAIVSLAIRAAETPGNPFCAGDCDGDSVHGGVCVPRTVRAVQAIVAAARR